MAPGGGILLAVETEELRGAPFVFVSGLAVDIDELRAGGLVVEPGIILVAVAADAVGYHLDAARGCGVVVRVGIKTGKHGHGIVGAFHQGVALEFRHRRGACHDYAADAARHLFVPEPPVDRTALDAVDKHARLRYHLQESECHQRTARIVVCGAAVAFGCGAAVAGDVRGQSGQV